ncbi:MAG: hypothetical protein COX70_00200 [Flavobacteriales bacterium CG_4_10_14_0_2_um_filter_32_8]|nr:MAG: hypothetical protein COX70_00200 [Flavobacteriales bacterium CG_4_10_14_0_2_um_filter_32_8]PJB15245.1 MAG: hypothetical protein CO118_04410 [Flavobacteriales bacterium CG_4_9_14_3_um_filter_32_8]
MKKFINPMVLGLFIVLSITTKGQNLGIDTTAINFGSLPDTINLNDNYTHTIVVQNFDTTVLNDTIYLVAAVDTSGALVSIDTVGSVFVTNFGLGDTISISYSENYTTLSGYKIGGNIVVVWPVAGSGSTVDTLYKNVFIKNPVSIPTVLAIDEQVLIYPTPFRDHIFIQNLSIKKAIKQIKLFDANGRLVYNEKYKQEIKMTQFIKGLYFIEIEFFDNSKKYKKLIKN